MSSLWKSSASSVSLLVSNVSVSAQNRMVLASTALNCAFFYCCNASTTRSGGGRNCFQAAESGDGVARPSPAPEERATPPGHPEDQACQRGRSVNADRPGAALPAGPATGPAASTGLCHASWSDMGLLHSSSSHNTTQLHPRFRAADLPLCWGLGGTAVIWLLASHLSSSSSSPPFVSGLLWQ